MYSILSARSNFSVGESILTIEQLVEDAKKVGAEAVALTDTMSITGMIDFTNRCKEAGIKPIIGCRLRLVDDAKWRKEKGVKSKAPPEYYITYYVRSERGLKALFRLLSIANDEDHFYYTAKLSFEDLFNEVAKLSADDVCFLTGDAYSVVSHKDAATILEKLAASVDASNVKIQLTPINTPYFDTINARGLELAHDMCLELVTVRPISYPIDGADAADVMNAVVNNEKLTSVWAAAPHVRDLHAMTELESERVASAYADDLIARRRLKFPLVARSKLTVGLLRANGLAETFKYEWSKAPVSLPVMAGDEFAAVVEECKAGWRERFAAPVFAHRPTDEELEKVYKPRLVYELGVLRKLGFSGYFLLVQDVVQYAKNHDILVGPGRGSVGGSLVAYLMGITDCDPIRFGLLFERFINPDRIDLPDADLDFMSTRRHEVIEYLISKYGRARVAGISNFGTLGPSSAIRDVSRVFGLPENEYACSKLVPKLHGQPVPLKKAADQVAEIAAFRDKYPGLWHTMLTLEGTLRNLSQHAAGVVVGGCDLVERAVVERRKGESVVCWDKRIVEEQGLVKMDILGLNTLDLIDLTMNYIRKRHSKRVDLMRVPLDDPKVLDSFAKGLTVGVFQFESGGMRRLLRELGSDGTITFDDITAATALYRPGPMESGMMDSYYKRKQGKEFIEYDHPLLEPILKPTFGVIVYQEQVMQISRVIAGYSAPEADVLRKIMGKKEPDKMAKQRDKFVNGCVATISCTEEWAGELFDKIAGFAGYGFNKSHSVEYTLISYQCMWLKTYYPVEFFAAALTLMDEDKLPALLKDAERSGIEIELPDINTSTDQFEILTDTKLSIPFSRIKGVGEKTATLITELRKTGGKFKDVEDFKARIKGQGRYCNVGHIAKLTNIGAFASIDPTSIPQRDARRVKDQVELLPGLITDTVPVFRSMETDKFTMAKVARLVRTYKEALYDEDEDSHKPVTPHFGKHARFMVIADAPSRDEAKLGKFAFGNGFNYVQTALADAGISREDAYWTGLLKKPKSGKSITANEINDNIAYLKEEIALTKPPAILLMGSQAVRQFLPEFKGKASDAAGKIIYDKDLDANLVIGFTPGEIHYDPDKQELLNSVIEKINSIVD